MPMKRTKNDESASNPNQTMKQYSLRLSTQLYEEASALYRELGIPISTALSAFFAGTVSAGTLPFSLSLDCARFLETCAHDDLFRAVRAELDAPGGPEQYAFPFHAAKAPRLETFSLGIPDEIRTGNYLWEKREKAVSIKLDPLRADTARTIFQRMGLSVSDAITLFLQQSLDVRGMPFQPGEMLAEHMKDGALKQLRKELEAGLKSQIVKEQFSVETQQYKEDTDRLLGPFHCTSKKEKCVLRLLQAFELDCGRSWDRWEKTCPGQKALLPGRDIRLFQLGFGIYEFLCREEDSEASVVRLRLIDGRKPYMIIGAPWMERQAENTRLIAAYKEEKKEKERVEKLILI